MKNIDHICICGNKDVIPISVNNGEMVLNGEKVDTIEITYHCENCKVTQVEKYQIQSIKIEKSEEKKMEFKDLRNGLITQKYTQIKEEKRLLN